MVRRKAGESGPPHAREEMPEEERRVGRSSASPLATALSSPVLEDEEGWWALKSPSNI